MDPPDTQLVAEETSTEEATKEVKLEPKEEPEEATSTTAPADSTSTDTKPSEPPPVVARRGRTACRFGVKCYRKNGSHRDEEAHPGDGDYTLPDYPEPPPHTPQCPYGSACYRRNPTHFQQFRHSGGPPAATLPSHSPPAKRRRRERQYSSDSDDSEDGADEMADFLDDNSEDEEDPYGMSDEDDVYDPDGDIDDSN